MRKRAGLNRRLHQSESAATTANKHIQNPMLHARQWLGRKPQHCSSSLCSHTKKRCTDRPGTLDVRNPTTNRSATPQTKTLTSVETHLDLALARKATEKRVLVFSSVLKVQAVCSLVKNEVTHGCLTSMPIARVKACLLQCLLFHCSRGRITCVGRAEDAQR